MKQVTPSSFEKYLLENKDSHYRFAYGYVKNRDDAMDVVSESVVKALRNLGSLKDSNALKSWFYQIMVRTALDFIKKSSKAVLLEDTQMEYLMPSHEDVYESFDLISALDSLPHELKTIVRLRYFEDFKIEDIASIMDLNLNTTKTKLYSALKMLRVSLDEEE